MENKNNFSAEFHAQIEINAEEELTKILQEELNKIWEETPLGYYEHGDAYHMGKGLMVNKETWDLYVDSKTVLTPYEFMVELIKNKYNMKQKILDAIDDLCSNFLYYDRKEDEDLSSEQLEQAVKKGDITIEEMVEKFKQCLERKFN
jgi:hypothetical protein